jgi:hypothetical protein
MTVDLHLSSDEVDAFAGAKHEEIAKLMSSLVDSNRDEVEGLLKPYCALVRGEVVHESASVDPEEVQVDGDRKTGTMAVEFTEHVHMGCKDIDKDCPAWAAIKFEIDLENRFVRLVGDDPIERDPDEI